MPRLTSLAFWLHGAGLLLSLIALVIGGVDNPDIGFPIAIAVVAALGMLSPTPPEQSTLAQLVHGAVTKGGIRQGVFIKLMFAIALLYAGLFPMFVEGGSIGTEALLLGIALGASSLGSELTAISIRRNLHA